MTETVNLKAYWERVSRFSQYPEDKRADGYALGLLAEVGEVCGVVDKWLRGKYDEAEMKARLLDELGDVCWYAVACLSLGESEWLEIPFEPDEVGKYGVVGLLRRLVDCACTESELEALDIVAFLANYADAGTTLQAVLDANVAKLEARHDPAR